MDLLVKNARLVEGNGPVDIGIADGRFVAIAPSLSTDGEILDAGGRLVSPGLVETHIHLDKSHIMDRCAADSGDITEAIQQVAAAKKKFTAEDVYERGRCTLEKCILNGATHVRTHAEVDPVIGLRGLEGILSLVDEYRPAVDLEICVFPQEGLLNNPGTDELMIEALKRGARVIGAAPYTDSDPRGQIDRIFEMAREFDADIDMHLDFGPAAVNMDLDYVCELTKQFDRGGRVAIGHVTKLAAATADQFKHAALRMADSGVALTVLPATDLFLMGREPAHGPVRGVTAAHKLLRHGVNCSLSTNNVMNPFTPFGDCSLIRMANLNANVCHVGTREDMRECFHMITSRSAKLLNIRDYGVQVGKPADFVVLDCQSPEAAIAELATVLFVYKRGRRSVTRHPAHLHRW